MEHLNYLSKYINTKKSARSIVYREFPKGLPSLVDLARIEIENMLIDKSINQTALKENILNHISEMNTALLRYETEHPYNATFLQSTYRPIIDIQERLRNAEELPEEIPHEELKTIGEKIILLNELGVIEHLKKRYANNLKSNNQLSILLSELLSLNPQSVQPALNALLNDIPSNKNYPKKTEKINRIILRLKD